ncbi:MAG: VWA domain-containing protein [Deltaproteobacteria bacterium]|nr:VWA domain-containing protein [Deltaproteobacteria bacterium]
MKKVRLAGASIGALVMATGGLGCTQSDLQPANIVEKRFVDNKVEASGAFCSSKPIEQRFPVKILLIMDGSGSLQFTDEGAIRVRAVTELLNRYVGNDSVLFHIILFNTFVQEFPASREFVDAYFLSQQVSLNAQLQVAEVLTDYQAALSTAFDLLRVDTARPEARNTKYVVVLFSDGQPSPVCCVCQDEWDQVPVANDPNNCSPTDVYPAGARQYNAGECPAVTMADINVGFSASRVCDGQREATLCNNLEQLQITFPDRWQDQFPDLPIEQNYNRTYQILSLVDDIVELCQGLDVGAFQLHTIMLWNEALPPAIQNILAVDYCRQSRLLRQIAERGGGEYREARRAEQIDFLQFDFTALKRTNKVRRIFVTNRNLMPGLEKMEIDSDGDGLSDQTEYDIGSDPLLVDTDGDGYSDLVEHRYKTQGTDPINPIKPYTPCLAMGAQPLTPADDPSSGAPGTSLSPSDDEAQATDADRDGLRDCEEELLGTSNTSADTDKDTIPDGLEVRFGLDPRLYDADDDWDFDGLSNIEEVLRNTNPRLDDPKLRRSSGFRYDLKMASETLDQRECFDLGLRHMLLGTTAGYFRFPSDPSTPQHIDLPGYNEIQIYEVESPSDDPMGETVVRGMCYRARYVEPDYREPADGLLTPAISDTDLRDLVNDPLAAMYGKECLGISPPCLVDTDCPTGTSCVDPTGAGSSARRVCQ